VARNEPDLLTAVEAQERLGLDPQAFRRLKLSPVGVYQPPSGRAVGLYARRDVDRLVPA
jgi:hypothetical protein